MASLSLIPVLVLQVTLLCCSCYSGTNSVALPVSSSAAAAQVDALLRWKASLRGYGSTVKSWKTASANNSSSPCTWNGILCNNQGNVTHIQIFDERMDGTLNNLSFSSFPHLSILTIAGANLSGIIPRDIGTHGELKHLDLSRNSFSGEVPLSLANMKNLSVLHLGHNKLTGAIASTLTHLTTTIAYLNLSTNHFNGSILQEIVTFNQLVKLDLSDNKLSGQILVEIGNLWKLEYLDLSRNNFNGLIPLQLGYCELLTTLSLSHNDLNGSIPSHIGNLSGLHSLNLSHNKLSGNIPPSLGMLGNGELLLDLSYNILEGPVPDFTALINDPSEAFGNNKGLYGPILEKPSAPEPEGPQPPSSSTTSSSFVLISFAVISIWSTVLFAFVVYRIRHFCWKKLLVRLKPPLEIEIEERNRNYGDLFSIWNFDGKIAYEDIVKATEDFDLKYCVGVGGYGSVYRAMLPSGAVVALKKLHRWESQEEAYERSFRNEIEFLTRIRHRNVVKLYGFCSNARCMFLIYEYMERGSLFCVLNDDTEAIELDWNKRVNVVKGVAHALSYMHHDSTPPIVHRDISSNNILLNTELEARVSDFGTARLVLPDPSNQTIFAGTYGYIAPGK